MQEKMTDGTYGEPEPLDFKKVKERLRDMKVESVLIFKALDKSGHPTKELRRAWRRFKKTGKISSEIKRWIV